MRHFILDTNIILRNPAILAKGNEQIRFVIPEPVIRELESFEHSRESGSQILDLVENSLQHGAYRLSIPPNEFFAPAKFDVDGATMHRVNIADFTIVKSIGYYQKQILPETSDNIFFVTDDMALAQFVKAIGIKTLDSNALEKELKNSSVINQDIGRRASFITSLQRKEFIISIVSGVLSSLIASLLLTTNFYTVFATINVWGTIVLIPATGIFLYWFRSKNKFAYGIAEVLFGLITGLRVFIPNFNYSQLDTTGLIQIAGSLYIMVRGMDNVGKGLIGTPFEVIWKRYFGES